jgi:tetratricopeptide (TPR) repeat protein
MQGQYADARQHFMASQAINHQLDNVNSLGWDLQRLGELALLEGDADGALAWLKQAAAMRDKTGDRLGTCAALEGLAFALMMKRDVNAIRLIAAADARRPNSDSLLVEPLRASYAAGIQRIRTMAGDQAWTAQVALGRHATVQQLLSAID